MALVLVAGGGLVMWQATDRDPADDTPVAVAAPGGAAAGTGEPTFTRLENPARTEVRDGGGRVVAVFTDGARTVRLTGRERTFSEPRFTKATVTTDAWIRLAPREWRAGAEKAGWFKPWLDKALADRSPDALAIMMDYIDGAKPRRNADGLQTAGDASFGPLSATDPDGRAENSDFYDYLGVSWKFPDGKKEQPSRSHFRALDCSGYIRMVYGYRMKYPLRGTNTKGTGLPRRAYAMAEFGPGVQLMPNTGRAVRDFELLQPGDLLFFNAGPIGGKHIEHSGIYLGLDDSGRHRFISSRSKADGPTMGDFGGDSLLDGGGYWATKLRTARRI
ncbi:NlpC/P60 family protein [Micromonospora halophytica]|uniref:NlpC/P60 family protein n=2 Tax=Micromonospora halophytica TaxID=47864 RepID=A0A1C5IZP9_9ACTN|nr:NlpC/P60 family protein [Micromonospora halophytica]